MTTSVKVLVTLATLPMIPFILLAAAVIGAAVGVKFVWMWLDFVWNDIRL